MLHVLAYLALLIGASAYGLVRGGAPERIAVVTTVAATILSGLVPAAGAIRFKTFEGGIFAVDLLMALILIGIALRAQRYWPMWAAAAQIDALVTHLMMLSPRVMPWSYSFAMAAWSYFPLIFVAIGSYRHQQRLARWGEDPPWSSSPESV